MIVSLRANHFFNVNNRHELMTLLPLHTEMIIIGLSGMSFTVDEGDGLQVCVLVLSGSTAGRTITISYSTTDGSATCKYLLWLY